MLVERFFAYLKSGSNKIAALRRARQEVRNAGFRHPFFWAPFILIGENGEGRVVKHVASDKPEQTERRANLRMETQERPSMSAGKRQATYMPGGKVFPKEITGHDGAHMVLVPAGEFIMGSSEEDIKAILRACSDCKREWYSSEIPKRRVYLDGFYIDKYELTNARFRAAGMEPKKDYGSKFNGPRQPVVGVTWFQARDYCAKVGKRLPTEAEWEKAARGMDGRKYSLGNSWDLDKAISWNNSGKKTHPVDRSYNTHESPYGAVDMTGNVWEWVQDWYGETYYRNAPLRNPKGLSSGRTRVWRGGSWTVFNYAGLLRAAYRDGFEPETQAISGGFRCSKALN